jgi:hypothetical protein
LHARTQAHVVDAGHKLLETHSRAAVSLVLNFTKSRMSVGDVA